MRLKELIERGAELDQHGAETSAAAPVKEGDWVRCEWVKHKAVIGRVVGEQLVKENECWVIQVNHSNPDAEWHTEEVFNKAHCKRVRASEISRIARKVIKPQARDGDIYGDGDV